MAEELKNLLDKIQKDGIDKAEAESDKIIADAKDKAKKIIADAEAKAASEMKKAEKEAQMLEARGKTALEQAARDVILSLGDSIQQSFKGIVAQEVAGAMDAGALKKIIASLIETYCKNELKESRVEILLSEDDQKALKKHFTSKFAADMKKGLEFKGSGAIASGFKVSVVKDTIEHDFTGEALTDALCTFLRPYLADIVRNAEK